MKSLLKISLFIFLFMTGVVWVFAFPVVHTTKPLSSSFYIWNQLWSDGVVESHSKWQNEVDSFHILAVSFQSNKTAQNKAQDLKVKRIQFDRQAVLSNKNTTFVFRINGNRLPAVKDIISEVNFLQSAGFIQTDSRLEIDFDSATRRLGEYRRWLAELNSKLDVPLGITTLPTWLESKELRPLLNALDYYVLQVHSVLSPEQGLFDADLALNWIQRFDRLSSTEFMVALPNYWYRAHLDRDHALMFLEAEQMTMVESAGQKDIFADPADIAEMMDVIETSRTRHMTGWIWFRMPTDNDQQIFSAQTIKQLMKGRYFAHKAKIKKKIIPETTAHYDFWFVNHSGVDVVVNNNWYAVSGCRFRHAIRRVNVMGDKVKFRQSFVMKPQQEIRIGWGQCEETL